MRNHFFTPPFINTILVGFVTSINTILIGFVTTIESNHFLTYIISIPAENTRFTFIYLYAKIFILLFIILYFLYNYITTFW